MVTDCAVKVWKADWMDGYFPIPERIDSAIFDTEPDLVSPDCQESIGSHYDRYFPSAARSAVSALSGGQDIPNGDEVCHLICEQGCGSQWIDPTGYFLAAEVRRRNRRGARTGRGGGRGVGARFSTGGAERAELPPPAGKHRRAVT